MLRGTQTGTHALRAASLAIVAVFALCVALLLGVGASGQVAFADEGANSVAQGGTAPVLQAADIADIATVADSKWAVSVEGAHNTTVGTVKIAQYADLKTAGEADSVRVVATMSYGGKETRHIEKTVAFSEIGTDGTFNFDFTTYGKFSFVATFLKNGAVVAEEPAWTVGVTADVYNISPVSATLPLTFFSLNLWGENSIRSTGPVILMLERPSAYNWNNLPEGAYALPYLTLEEASYQPGDFEAASDLFRAHEPVMADYVRDLYEISPDSQFNLYCVDYYCDLVQRVLYANRIPESNYTITLMSDGSFTYMQFAASYDQENNDAKHQELINTWNAGKEYAYSTGQVADGFKQAESSYMLWALVDAEPNARFWVARKDLMATNNDGNAFGKVVQANPKLVQVSISSLLANNIQSSEQSTAEFKALYDFNDSYFAAAKEQGKDVMVFLGSRVTSEASFLNYARFTMSYYGDSYGYYYKGHPGTPTDLYPEKQQQLATLGITDVDSSIAAELILFFNPEIYLSGYASSTYASVPVGMGKGMFNMTKEAGLANPQYQNMEFWASAVSESTPANARALCIDGHENYLVEFSDSVSAEKGYDIAIWDATKPEIRYYKLAEDGTYELVDASTDIVGYQAVPEGTYVIQTSMAAGMVLDVAAGSPDSGANIQLYDYNGTDAQKWKVTYDDAGLATIVNIGSGKALDVSGASTQSGANIWQYDSNDSTAQKWRIVAQDDGSFAITSALGETIAVDVAGASTRNGANVQTWAANGTPAQKFNFLSLEPSINANAQAEIADGVYRISPAVNANAALDVAAWGKTNGTNAHIWQSLDGDHQQFKIEKQGSGFYRITNVMNGLVLDLAGGSIISGANVQYWTPFDGNKNQEWAIFQGTGGSYTLQNVASGLVLDVSGGNGSNGANVQGWLANGSEAQRWIISESVDPRAAIDELAASCKDSVADGTYVATTALPGARALDVQWGSMANGANVQTYAANATPAQSWKITHDETGYLTIINVASSKALDVSGADVRAGANVQQYEPNGSLAQKWIAVPAGEGGFTIVSALSSDLALDIAGAGDYDTANVQLYSKNGTTAQRFELKAA